MRYPVNEETCASCSACSLVTRDSAGNYIEEKDYYFQCLAGVESECGKKADSI